VPAQGAHTTGTGSSGGSGVSTGGVVGIVIGLVVLTIAAAVTAYVVHKRRKERAASRGRPRSAAAANGATPANSAGADDAGAGGGGASSGVVFGNVSDPWGTMGTTRLRLRPSGGSGVSTGASAPLLTIDLAGGGDAVANDTLTRGCPGAAADHELDQVVPGAGEGSLADLDGLTTVAEPAPSSAIEAAVRVSSATAEFTEDEANTLATLGGASAQEPPALGPNTDTHAAATGADTAASTTTMTTTSSESTATSGTTAFVTVRRASPGTPAREPSPPAPPTLLPTADKAGAVTAPPRPPSATAGGTAVEAPVAAAALAPTAVVPAGQAGAGSTRVTPMKKRETDEGEQSTATAASARDDDRSARFVQWFPSSVPPQGRVRTYHTTPDHATSTRTSRTVPSPTHPQRTPLTPRTHPTYTPYPTHTPYPAHTQSPAALHAVLRPHRKSSSRRSPRGTSPRGSARRTYFTADADSSEPGYSTVEEVRQEVRRHTRQQRLAVGVLEASVGGAPPLVLCLVLSQRAICPLLDGG
jgi:hypothetical protein